MQHYRLETLRPSNIAKSKHYRLATLPVQQRYLLATLRHGNITCPQHYVMATLLPSNVTGSQHCQIETLPFEQCSLGNIAIRASKVA